MANRWRRRAGAVSDLEHRVLNRIPQTRARRATGAGGAGTIRPHRWRQLMGDQPLDHPVRRAAVYSNLHPVRSGPGIRRVDPGGAGEREYRAQAHDLQQRRISSRRHHHRRLPDDRRHGVFSLPEKPMGQVRLRTVTAEKQRRLARVAWARTIESPNRRRACRL